MCCGTTRRRKSDPGFTQPAGGVMLLTRKSSDALVAAGSSSLVSSLARGVSRAIPTMDRRAFLRRSGLGVGAGLAASQLTLVQKSARAANAPADAAARQVVVKRT